VAAEKETRRSEAKAELRARREVRNERASEAEQAVMISAEANQESIRLGADLEKKSKTLKLLFHKVAEGEQDPDALPVWEKRVDDANLSYSSARAQAVMRAEEAAEAQGRYQEAAQAVAAAEAVASAANAAADASQEAAQAAALGRVHAAR
jgi:hypothetical protein